MPTARSRVAISLPTSAFGRRSTTTSEDFRISLRSTLRVSTAASTVSTAVPVKRSLVGEYGDVVGDLEGDVETAVAGVVPRRRSALHAAGDARRRACRSPEVALEGQTEVGGVAEAVAALQRAGDLQFDVLAERCGRDERVTETSREVAGVDADHLMGAQRRRAPARSAASRWCRDPARG